MLANLSLPAKCAGIELTVLVPRDDLLDLGTILVPLLVALVFAAAGVVFCIRRRKATSYNRLCMT